MRNTEKYKKLFESVKRFVLDTKLSFMDEIDGLDESTIKEFENEYSIKFPASFYAFLLEFGKKIKVRRTSDLFYLTLNDVKNATLIAQKENYKKIILRDKGFLDYNTDDETLFYFNKIIDIDKVIFITQYHRWFSIGFIDSNHENPIIYHINEKEYYSTDWLSFTNFIRSILFQAIKYRFNLRFLKQDIEKETGWNKENLIELRNLDIDKLTWAQFYIDNNEILYRPQYYFEKHRLAFYKLVSEQEERTGYIMTIDEFEWAFIDYLREQGYEF